MLTEGSGFSASFPPSQESGGRLLALFSVRLSIQRLCMLKEEEADVGKQLKIVNRNFFILLIMSSDYS